MFRNLLRSLESLNCMVTLESKSYVVRSKENDKVLAEIACTEKHKDKILLGCYMDLLSKSNKKNLVGS